MTLLQAENNKTYRVSDIDSNQEGIREFLFTLGCYPGENITLISRLTSNFVINVKDARYSIDEDLAQSILI